MKEGSIHQEDITIINIMVINIMVYKHYKHNGYNLYIFIYNIPPKARTPVSIK